MGDTEHKGTPTALGSMARVVEIPWTCKRTGDCCRETKEMLVTVQERDLLEKHALHARRPLVFRRAENALGRSDDRFRIMELHPCPFLSDQGLCLVHEIRPYNCRRFMCGRVDVARESYEIDQFGSCLNLADRMETSQRFAHFYNTAERKHQKDWAVKMGWKRDPSKVEVKL